MCTLICSQIGAALPRIVIRGNFDPEHSDHRADFGFLMRHSRSQFLIIFSAQLGAGFARGRSAKSLILTPYIGCVYCCSGRPLAASARVYSLVYSIQRSCLSWCQRQVVLVQVVDFIHDIHPHVCSDVQDFHSMNHIWFPVFMHIRCKQFKYAYVYLEHLSFW